MEFYYPDSSTAAQGSVKAIYLNLTVWIHPNSNRNSDSNYKAIRQTKTQLHWAVVKARNKLVSFSNPKIEQSK